MLAKRIIPCLDVKAGKVVKGIRFRNHEVVGEIVSLANLYAQAGADELVFYDITASPDQRTVSAEWVKKVAKVIDIPFCVAGGIKSVEQAGRILANGADKISINSPAIENPSLITQLADAFGRQCVVIGIDSHYDITTNSLQVCQYTGDTSTTQKTTRNTLDWAIEVQKLGAGEIVLNTMNHDGCRQGYDLQQLQKVRDICHVPLIASGGAGNMEHFIEVFQQTDVDGALAASVFHHNLIEIIELKKLLCKNNIKVRIT